MIFPTPRDCQGGATNLLSVLHHHVYFVQGLTDSNV